MGKVSISLGEAVRGERVIEVNVDNYIDLAGRTNNPDYVAVGERMVAGDNRYGIPLLVEALANALDGDLDQVKKHLFYGKELKTDTIKELVESCHPGTNARDMSVFQGNQEMIDIFHGVVGIATEAGEMLRALLTFMETGKLDLVNLGEECGDLDWYKALILKRAKLSIDQVMTTNIQKLAKRFPHGFNESQAIHRNVEAERVILDQGMAENTGHHFVD